ncbi:Uncharacterised protein [Staphylococcus aureus]|nr:Uncharacterised protein [Staphylococcus aureus]
MNANPKKCITKKSFSNIFKFFNYTFNGLDFNFKEAQAQNKNNIADKNIETLNEKEIEKELDYIYGKIIVLDKDGTAKDVNLENAKSRYGYVPEGFQKLKNDIEN